MSKLSDIWAIRELGFSYWFNRLALLMQSLGPLFICCITLFFIVNFVLAVEHASQNAPQFMQLDKLTFSAKPDTSVVLGRRELAQDTGTKSAEDDHIQLTFSQFGEWELQRIAETRKLDVGFPDVSMTVYSDRFPIPSSGSDSPKDAKNKLHIKAGEAHMTLFSQDGTDLHIFISDAAGQAAHYIFSYSGTATTGSGDALPRCVEWGGWTHLRNWLRRITRIQQLHELGFSFGVTARNIAYIGGSNTCILKDGTPLVALPGGVDDIEFGIRAGMTDGLAFLFPRKMPVNAPVAYEIEENGSFTAQHSGSKYFSWPVWNSNTSNQLAVNSFTVGYTLYTIESNGDRVSVSPLSKVPLTRAAQCGSIFGDVSPHGADLTSDQLRCPGSSLERGVAVRMESRKTPPALNRLLVPIVSNDDLAGEEKVFWTILVITFAGWWLFNQSASAEQMTPRRRLQLALQAMAFLLVAGPYWLELMPGEVYGFEKPVLMLYASGGLLMLGTLLLFIDEDCSMLGQLFWLITLSLALVGALSLFTLSAEGANTDWERFFVKQKYFVLDLLPLTFMTIIATSPLALRRSIGEAVLGTAAFIRFSLLLLAVFIAWVFFGDQQGLVGFQPVELGKFFVVLAISGVITQWTVRSRLLSDVVLRGSWVAFFSLALFGIAMAAVPYFHSDYSPIVIVLATSICVVALLLPSIVSRGIRERKHDDKEIEEIPLRFRPKREEKLWGLHPCEFLTSLRRRITAFFWHPKCGAPMLLVLVIATAGSLPFLVPRLIPGVPNWEWTAQKAENQISALEKKLGEGRRTVLERLLIWADTRYDRRVGSETIPLSLRDLNYQVLRSRSAIAHSPCSISPEMASLTFLAPERSSSILDYFGICTPHIAGTEIAISNDCSTNDLKEPVEPHCIPVVQSDFAGSYLISRHGIGTASLVAFLQLLILGIAGIAYFQIQSAKLRQPVAAAANDATAALILGSCFLFVLQWILSWGNVFGLLPIMGQPMTWTSAATSHHLFMALPASGAIFAGIRVARIRRETIPFRYAP
ncbi:hypothetical protein [Cohaesibacter gelatinilyticus]|uniref:Uncharacterized protein n=1 Tax=Cohaesibacter gelatinilyticus TaxID=372072 RepID=A0A285PJQ6_9HYPH|nr:hypothetical protein [Cohaesibacter gelatinilyticus]SNZ20111.1 hypothetical protein SAMN06265368_3212 [Cohaesibacter gelatinilyticus]